MGLAGPALLWHLAKGGSHSPREAPRLLLTCVWMFLHPSPSTVRGPAPRDEVGQGAGTGWQWGALVKGATPTATPGKGAGAQHRALPRAPAARAQPGWDWRWARTAGSVWAVTCYYSCLLRMAFTFFISESLQIIFLNCLGGFWRRSDSVLPALPCCPTVADPSPKRAEEILGRMPGLVLLIQVPEEIPHHSLTRGLFPAA